jgi:tyrosyl-tRNA synthetase
LQAGPSTGELSLDEKYELCRSIGEECISEEELRNLLEKKPHPVAYDGFEPSGRMHIAQVTCPAGIAPALQLTHIMVQGVMKAINVNKLTKSGCHFKFW